MSTKLFVSGIADRKSWHVLLWNGSKTDSIESDSNINNNTDFALCILLYVYVLNLKHINQLKNSGQAVVKIYVAKMVEQ